ncbi:MAG TPA: aminotransferase class III-fold pyridoxal phosphate-dependent enzyme [Acetobacteraceae bacterium]|nr:aminotransferase class III-fold pyridoxal phosphate-dependent enzyme [Acetobacteraceae bacterium]
MESTVLAAYAAGAAVLSVPLVKLKRRLELSRAKHRSLAGHARLARRIAALVPFYEYDEHRFFRSDNPPENIAVRRRDGFLRLTSIYRERFARTSALTARVQSGASDLQFTSAYRVPFQYSHYVRQHLAAGSILESSAGVTVSDVDGNILYDVANSYGVNLFGYDFYKECIARGAELVRDLGPVLGAYHPIVAYNIERIRQISGLDEVSFHMSGTEAVMQAVRLARYHTRRSHIVRFCGAYHGWWDDVQPGIGNPSSARETYTLAEMSEHTLHVLRTRRDIACVLVNPLQALHPNAGPPADSSLVDSGRTAHFDRQAYTRWLQQLRAVCSERRIALIFDEVFVGFRLALGGAQEYFGVKADLVTYGKTLGGGFPVGVVCGRHEWMKRFREDRPADICLARGTFNSHPYVMGAMNEFLHRLETPEMLRLYDGLDEMWNRRTEAMNLRFGEEGLPVRVENLSSIWTVCYTRPSRYNWMLQYYLRAEGLVLSWVGTGRLIFSLNYSDADFAAVMDRFLAAARAMDQDGWWWTGATSSNKSIRRQLLRELLASYWGQVGARSGAA